MAKTKADKFPKRLCVRQDDDATYWVVIGEPGAPGELDAGDGDRVAIYELKETRTLRRSARFE